MTSAIAAARCPDCRKPVTSQQYHYLLRSAGQEFYILEQLSSGSFLGFRRNALHGHYPAPRIITPIGDAVLEQEDGEVTTLV